MEYKASEASSERIEGKEGQLFGAKLTA